MNHRFYIMCLLVMLATAAHSQTCTEMEKSVKQVTCKLTTPELQKRKATVIAELKAMVLERHELNDGYSFKFNGSDHTIDRLIEFIKSERMCCDFFTFQLTIEEDFAILAITGPNGTKVFLQEEVDL